MFVSTTGTTREHLCDELTLARQERSRARGEYLRAQQLKFSAVTISLRKRRLEELEEEINKLEQQLSNSVLRAA